MEKQITTPELKKDSTESRKLPLGQNNEDCLHFLEYSGLLRNLLHKAKPNKQKGIKEE